MGSEVYATMNSILALVMRNQIDMARKVAIQAFTINSANRQEWEAAGLAAGSVQFADRGAHPGDPPAGALPLLQFLEIGKRHLGPAFGQALHGRPHGSDEAGELLPPG